MRLPASLSMLLGSLVLAVALPAAAALAVEAADAPAKPEVKGGEAVGGLQMSLILKERTFRMGGGDNATETKIKVPTIQLKNVGDKPLVLNFQLTAGGGMGGFFGRGGGDSGPVKLFAKDAAGKEVPRREENPAPREGEPKPEDKPAQLTVLKPGQVLEQAAPLGSLRFPADGKYTLWAELEVKPADEVLPGVKPWSGKLKSNEIEYDYKARGGRGNRPGGGGGGGQNPPAAVPPAPGEKENF